MPDVAGGSLLRFSPGFSWAFFEPVLPCHRVQFWQTENSWRLDRSCRGCRRRITPRMVDAAELCPVTPACLNNEITHFVLSGCVALLPGAPAFPFFWERVGKSNSHNLSSRAATRTTMSVRVEESEVRIRARLLAAPTTPPYKMVQAPGLSPVNSAFHFIVCHHEPANGLPAKRRLCASWGVLAGEGSASSDNRQLTTGN